MKYQKITGGVCAAQGFVASGVHCGIRKNKTKKDLALIYSKTPCTAACVYTTNKVQAAPIQITKENLAAGPIHAIICNSGNANACNADGAEKAKMMCQAVGEALGIAPHSVVVASTGVIGQSLPIEPIQSGMAALVAGLQPEGDDAAEAILTTDTGKKECAVTFPIGGKLCTLGAMAKGSGMIHPNMATMLGFLTTDAAVEQAVLQSALSACVKDTFNMVSVDGDTSTNDMVALLANGAAGNAPFAVDSEDYTLFCAALMHVCKALSKLIAKDGEGATKLLECKVSGGANNEIARIVAKSVITSSLFKAAMFGQDANWGRILCAVGYADAAFDITKVCITLSSKAGTLPVCENGFGVAFSEDLAASILQEDEICIAIALAEGTGTATAWGCDLTYDYVKINGDYRT